MHIKQLLLKNSSKQDVSQKPPWNIDVVWTWCGRPENEYCRYSEDLKYSLRSVMQNMPWVHRIFLVVPDEFQAPFWMQQKQKQLHIVRSRDIIPTKFLPTYNSNVVQSYIYRIKGLSEHFCFLADDMYVGRSTSWKCFFASTPTGLPINRHYAGAPDHGIHPNHRIPYVRMWVNAIKKYGIHHTRIQHQILPYTKTLVQKYAAAFHSELQKGSKQRTRSGEQDFNLLRFVTSLTTMHHEAVRVETEEAEWKLIDSRKPVVDYFVEADDIPGILQIPKIRPRFFCINNSSPMYSHIYEVLQAMFPHKTPFEREFQVGIKIAK